jgi:tetratricopeptide (TPR) repeat protein
LNNVTFEGSSLPNAAFSQSAIVGSKFDNTSLELSRFDGAMIADTSFSNVNLRRSIFDRALFCQNVQFSESDVRSASFRYVTFDAGHVPQFNGTAWWLAVGWSMQQVQSLAPQSADLNYKDTPAFKDDMQYYEKWLSTVPDPTIARAMALNGKAWALATYGVDLADAERLSQQALTMVRGSAGKLQSGSVVREEANDMDTLAYVQMQEGKMSEALENFKAATQKVQGYEATLGKALIFRYALAQFIAGQRDEAIKNLKRSVDSLKYVPSHEMYLLRQHIKDEFLTNLESLMNKNFPESAAPSATCPANSRG